MENASSNDPWNQEIPLAPWLWGLSLSPPPPAAGVSSWCSGAGARGRAGNRTVALVGHRAAFGAGTGSSLRFLQPLTARATVRAMATILMGFIAFTLEAGRFSLAKEALTME
jgi:hypothetical protein